MTPAPAWGLPRSPIRELRKDAKSIIVVHRK